MDAGCRAATLVTLVRYAHLEISLKQWDNKLRHDFGYALYPSRDRQSRGLDQHIAGRVNRIASALR